MTSLILIKRIVILLIALFEVLGLILAACGIFLLYKAYPSDKFTGGFFITIGSITMIIAIFGFFAAIRESPVSLLMYFGVQALMIRILVVLINTASRLKDEIEEKLSQAWAFKRIFIPDPVLISRLESLMHCLGVIKTVCWLIILVEVVGAVFSLLLYRNVKRSRLAQKPVPSSVPNNVAVASCTAVIS